MEVEEYLKKFLRKIKGRKCLVEFASKSSFIFIVHCLAAEFFAGLSNKVNNKCASLTVSFFSRQFLEQMMTCCRNCSCHHRHRHRH